LTNTLQAALILYFYPERWGDAAAAAQVKASAEQKIGTMLDQLDAEFARHGKPWLLGAGFSVCDPYAFVPLPLDARLRPPARSLPHLQAVPGADARAARGQARVHDRGAARAVRLKRRLSATERSAAFSTRA
jgi:glutathione S-transferase